MEKKQVKKTKRVLLESEETYNRTKKQEKNNKKKNKVVFNTYKIDLSGKVFGRIASEIALLLSGKRRADFSFDKFFGDKVVAFNLDKIKIKGKHKEQKKIYYWYSGYPGGIKQKTLADYKKEGDLVIVFRKAVFGMLKRNRLRAKKMKNLKVYLGDIS